MTANKILIEAIVVCPLALISAIRGMTAIVNHSIWVAPKHGPAIELSGKCATYCGIGFIGTSFLILAGWAATKISDRLYGLTLCGCAGVIAVFGFAGAFISTPQ